MSSKPVTECQICGSKKLDSVFWLGYLPPVNTLQKIGEPAVETPFYPAELLQCKDCSLVQLGYVVDAEILFPPEYSYTSGVTKMLKDNFADLCKEVQELGYGKAGDLVVDVGSNDGSNLENFKEAGFKVIGIEPTDAADIANAKDIFTSKGFLHQIACAWNPTVGTPKAQVITACNVFAHMPDVNGAVEDVLTMLAEDGVFVVECQYLPALQYDTVYHEHLRYYSLKSLAKLFDMHGMEIIYNDRIPTHGGSIRVYAARKGKYAINPDNYDDDGHKTFVDRIAGKSVDQRLNLLSLVQMVKRETGNQRIYGIGAPSRAATLVNYVGLDGILDCVCELPQSKKIGCFMPGTKLPIYDEKKLYEDQPEYAMLLSWHLGDSLIASLKQKGFSGKYIIPLPLPRIVE